MHRNQVTFTRAGGGQVPAPVEWASVDEIDYQPDGVVAKDATVPGGLDGPRGVAVDATGNLYIADTEQHRIVRMTPAGSFSIWGSHGTGNGQFDRPTGLAVDANGFVYVADTMNHRIQKFDASGNFVSAWGSYGSGLGEFDMPVDVDVTIIGGITFVYVADSNNHRVVRTNGDGTLPSNFGARPDAGRILGVCAPRGYGHVYATDPSNKRIFRWAWNGPYVGAFGPPSPHHSAVIDLDFPMGIEQDFDGYVYVVDNGARVVKKFDSYDPNFRQIAQFGLTVPAVPGPTPEDEFVDPVDVAVTDLKAAYVVDRQRKQVVRYTPTDSQELWVHVPAGAASGPLRVRTDEGEASAQFNVWWRAGVEVVDAYLCQGLVEYPLVAGKKTIIRYQMRTVGATMLHNYHWGSPVHDSALCRVLRDGTDVGQVEGQPVFITATGGFMSSQVGFEIHFEIPHWLVNSQGDYRFEVRLDRTGTPGFHHTRNFNHTFHNRRSYKIISSPISHLKYDGTRVSPGPMFPALFYVGEPQHFLDWMDWAQLYSGYLNYNRLYPVRHSLADISEYGIWVNDTMADGINNDDEVRDMLLVLELTRRRINEDTGAGYDFMLGVVDRDEVRQDWGGVTSPSYRSAIVSIGHDQNTGDPLYDLGAVIGHELLHQHDVDHQSDRERAESDKLPWNSFTGEFVYDPVTLMYVLPEGVGYRTLTWNDDTAFVEGRVNGSPSNYDILFDALANPHPKHYRQREIALGPDGPSRPAGAQRNFNLVGSLKASGEFTRLASWVGAGTSPVTPQAEDSEDWLLFLDADGMELLRWRVRISFGLQALTKGRSHARLAEDTALVSLTVPFPDATARVELVAGGRTVWSADVPSQAPTVQLVAPKGGEHIGPMDTLTVEWEASHPEGVELEYAIEYSFDGGETFRPLATALKETHYEWQAGLTASTGHVRVRVVASDGFNEAADVSDDISVGDTPSRVAILQPRRGEVIPQGKAIHLLAMASDVEQGPLQLNQGNTRWLLDGEVVLGIGNDIDVREIQLTTPRGTVSTPLPVGEHRLRVDATIAPGKTVSDEIPIKVVADSDRDGVPDDVETERGTSPTDPGDGASVAPIYPFGQWRFHRWRNRTLFQISHLGTGKVLLELGFLDETGEPLAGHRLRVVEGDSLRRTLTDDQGWVEIRLGSLQTALLVLTGDRCRRKGFGSCYVRVAAGSPLTETIIQAHGWIYHRRAWWLFGWESQGTVVINEGKPLQIRGAQSWSASSPKMAVPAMGYRLLGRLQMATHMTSRMLEEREQG